MKKIFNYSLMFCMALFLCQCDGSINEEDSFNNPVSQQDLESQNVGDLQSNVKLIWDKVKNTTFSKDDFLVTKGKMSDQAIDYLTPTGWNNDFAYNQIVYISALKRAKKHLSVKDGVFVCDLKSGADINISEDLYEYILDLFADWNKWIQEGRVEIVQINGEYNVETILPKQQAYSLRYAVDLTRMSTSDCWSAVKDVVDECPLGQSIGAYFILNFGESISGQYTGTDGKMRRYSVNDGCTSHGQSDPSCIYNIINHNAYISDSQMHIYSIRNNSRLSIASYQLQK